MNIKFVSYTGHYPCLCLGDLTLNINGKDITFKSEDYKNFWYSGGDYSCMREKNEEISIAPWRVNVQALPDFLKPYAEEIKNIINENIEWGCCGGER